LVENHLKVGQFPERMKHVVVGGLALLVGCATPDPKLAQQMEKLNITLDRLVRVASYHDGEVLMTQRDYKGAAEKYTIALEKLDTPHYRIARFRANINLAELSDELARKEIYKRCHEDADAYIVSLPDQPDGYVAKATALYHEHKNLGGKPERLTQATQFLLRAKSLIEEEKKQLLHFGFDGVNKLYRLIRFTPREY